MSVSSFLIRIVAPLIAAFLVGGAAYGQSVADVGLVNQLSGDVTYSNESSSNAKVQAFMKIRQGDRFNVPSGGQLRITYFQGGRQESWKGPASFKTGAQQSDLVSGAKPEIAQLPAAVQQRIKQIPELVQIAKTSRAGGIAVRGLSKKQQASLEQQADVAAARDTYQKLRTQLPADDITPELYLFTVLQEYLLYDEMKVVSDEMVRKQPNNLDVQELAAWVKSRNQPQ